MYENDKNYFLIETTLTSNDFKLLEHVINLGIDSHLEGFTKSEFYEKTNSLGKRYVFNFHREEIPIVVRRLRELGDEEAEQFADDIETLSSEIDKTDEPVNAVVVAKKQDYIVTLEREKDKKRVNIPIETDNENDAEQVAFRNSGLSKEAWHFVDVKKFSGGGMILPKAQNKLSKAEYKEFQKLYYNAMGFTGYNNMTKKQVKDYERYTELLNKINSYSKGGSLTFDKINDDLYKSVFSGVTYTIKKSGKKFELSRSNSNAHATGSLESLKSLANDWRRNPDKSGKEFSKGGGLKTAPKKINLSTTKSIKTDFGTYKLGLKTKDYVYFVNESEGDDSANTIMYNAKGELLSDNYFASNDLFERLTEIANGNEFYVYIKPSIEKNLNEFKDE
jgi:hypothetical protein